MRVNPRSLVFRFSIPVAAILVALVASFLILSYWQSQRLLREQLDTALQADQVALAESYDIGGLGLVTTVLKRRLAQLKDGGKFYLLTDASYTPILGNLPTWPDGLPKQMGWAEVDYERGERIDKDIRFLASRLDEAHYLLIGYETVQIEALEDYAEFNSTLYISAVLLLGIAGGLFLHVTLARRLKAITALCQQIRDGDLYVRFSVPDRGDEVDDMGSTLNEMLDRIQALMQDIQYITDNIAHDLRSPITRVRSQLEDLSSGAADASNQVKLLNAIEALDELVATFNAMLRISKIETGAEQFNFERTDLSHILQDAVDFLEPLAEENGQRIVATLSEEAPVLGERNLLFQAVCNVLENAIKYGPDHSDIIVNTAWSGARCEIKVSDTGNGIDPAEIENVTKRFYRLDHSRHQSGNGLGLALVKAVVHLHKGDLVFSSAAGLTVSLRFTAASAE